MVLLFLPFSLLCRKLHWAQWWVFVGGGIVFGHLTFLFVISIPSAVHDPASLIVAANDIAKNPSLLWNLFWAGETRHYQLGVAFTSGVVMGVFWIIAVPKNSWFLDRGEPVTVPDTTEILDQWD